MKPANMKVYTTAELDAMNNNLIKDGVRYPHRRSNVRQLWQWIDRHGQMLNHVRNTALREMRWEAFLKEQARRFAEHDNDDTYDRDAAVMKEVMRDCDGIRSSEDYTAFIVSFTSREAADKFLALIDPGASDE